MEGRRRDESDEEQKFDGDDGVLVGEVRSALSADMVLLALKLAAKIAHPPTRSVFEGLARRRLRPAHFCGMTFEEVEGWVADTYFEGDGVFAPQAPVMKQLEVAFGVVSCCATRPPLGRLPL